MARVVALGECMLELSPRPDGAWDMGHAGDTLNTLWTLRALVPHEWRMDYVTAFGDDPFSRAQQDFMAAAGIGTQTSLTIPGVRPGLYAIDVRDGERHFTYWRNDSAARRFASDAASLARALDGARLAYFSGISLGILGETDRARLFEALATARRGGTIIAFDPNFRPALWIDAAGARAAIDLALATSDIVLPTFPDEKALYGDADPQQTADRLRRVPVPEFVIKNGTDDALAGAGETMTAIPCGTPALPVDPTGAGDSFNGAYLAARLLGHAPADAAARAHRVAGAVVGLRGALAPPDRLRQAFDIHDG